jgi:hypothetical protein
MIRESELSPHMAEALRVAVMHDGLVRWAGGFWTYKGCDAADCVHIRGRHYDVPEWHVSAHTVKALERRGLISKPNWKTARVTDAGVDSI